MNIKFFDRFLEVLNALGKEKVDYILIGGFAVILHGMPRFTQDIDIFIKMNPENIEKLRKALHNLFQDDSIYEITLNELNDYSVIRYGAPEGFYIDIMARLGEIATYETLEYETVTFNNVPVNIATPLTLFNLKKNTLRPEDRSDAFYLSELMRQQKGK
jgi:hypothetical protein